MANIAIITDQHFGARGDSLIFDDYFKRFYSEVFFPYIDANNIKVIYNLGDTFDRRKFVNFNTLSRCKRYFFDEIQRRGLEFNILIGNHDMYYKNTLSVNSPRLLLSEYSFNLIETPKEVVIDNTPVLCIPWICNENYNQTMKKIEETKAQIVFGHLEINGFEMNRGSICDTGLNSEIFKKFDLVYTGHFHHKSSKENVEYLGCPYEMTWNDYNDKKGFHIFNTETRELTFIENPNSIFHKFDYDDSEMKIEDLSEMNFSVFNNIFMKLIVRNKTNPYLFDMFVDKLEKGGVFDLQIVDDILNIDIESDVDIINEAKSTMEILQLYIEQTKTNIDKKRLTELFRNLYSEALLVE